MAKTLLIEAAETLNGAQVQRNAYGILSEGPTGPESESGIAKFEFTDQVLLKTSQDTWQLNYCKFSKDDMDVTRAKI
jgi:hypothetical protein